MNEVTRTSKELNDLPGWIDHLIGDGKRDNIIVPMSIARELQAHFRAAPEPPAVPSKFDLAFEVMRLMDREELDTLQSCHFGYVLRVEREKHTPPPAALADVVKELRANGYHDRATRGEKLGQPPVPALRDVIAERERQKSDEGWTPEHDDEHEGGALAVAGAAYAYHAAWHQRDRKNSDRPPQLDSDEILTSLWPFDEEWWKPKSPRRDLVRAAALILAEIERLDRATATKCEGQS